MLLTILILLLVFAFVSFKCKKGGVYTDAKYPGFSATLTIDSENPGCGSLLLENKTKDFSFMVDKQGCPSSSPVWCVRPGTEWISPGKSSMYHIFFKTDPLLLDLSGAVDGVGCRYFGRFHLITAAPSKTFKFKQATA